MRTLVVFFLASGVYGADYMIDPVHSTAGFAVTHMMVATVRGQFSKVTGSVSFDPKNLGASKVEATIDATTVDSQQAKRDAHLRSADFLDAERFPMMSFRSSRWYREAGKLKIAGDLTIRGVSKPVVLDVTGQAAELKSVDDVAIIGASASTKISRKAFGLMWNKLTELGGAVAGDEVTITLDIEGKKR